MIAALLLLTASTFDTGAQPTSFYQNHPLYIHAPTYPFTVPLAPTTAKCAKITSTYTITNNTLTIENPYPFPMVQIEVTSNIVTQHQGLPGVQYPLLGGIGLWQNLGAIAVNVPPFSTVSIPLNNTTIGPFDDVFGEDGGACGATVWVPTSMVPFQSPTVGFEPLHAIYFCPMTEIRVGSIYYLQAEGIRRIDYGYTVQHHLVRQSADIQAAGTYHMYDANGVEL